MFLNSLTILYVAAYTAMPQLAGMQHRQLRLSRILVNDRMMRITWMLNIYRLDRYAIVEAL